MILFKNLLFSVETFNPNDANSLHSMMQMNAARFSRYFPQTLANNSTLEKSVNYIELKNNEIDLFI